MQIQGLSRFYKWIRKDISSIAITLCTYLYEKVSVKPSWNTSNIELNNRVKKQQALVKCRENSLHQKAQEVGELGSKDLHKR